jgi:hypothetical protein
VRRILADKSPYGYPEDMPETNPEQRRIVAAILNAKRPAWEVRRAIEEVGRLARDLAREPRQLELFDFDWRPL